MKIEFEAHPIETAPKNREFAAWNPTAREWFRVQYFGADALSGAAGGWLDSGMMWSDLGLQRMYTHWAEIADMAVPE